VQFWSGGFFALECGTVRQYRVIFDTGTLGEHLAAIRAQYD
jgi:hypothetical protein